MKRRSGVLMHLSSLYGEYGIGSMGKEAREFVDFLCDLGFGVWQVLPFCMTDECNSPYKSPASFSFNPYFIDLEILCERGYIKKSELYEAQCEDKYVCQYEILKEKRLPLLFSAAMRAYGNREEREAVRSFCEKNSFTGEAALFLALRDSINFLPWQKWTERTPSESRLFFWQFIQYEFCRQWLELKDYANKRGIKIIGDIPIYVSLDSADVFFAPQNFLLNKRGFPTEVAGVPPDYFSPDGQLWGNPIYNYKKMREDGFYWWRERIRHTLTMFDGARIDHFRGLDSYWSVPQGSNSAATGRWKKAPSSSILKALCSAAGEGLLIAEDLGDITESVRRLRDKFALPGMRVFEFAFLGDRESPHLPHNYINNSVAYTGTHDNNTLLGYLFECDGHTRAKIFDYCGYTGDSIDEGARWVIKSLFSSSAGIVIFPVQDILGFGSDTRMNTPGKAEGNWAYRVTREQLNSVNRAYFKCLGELYGRDL